jgi:transcriptional regulator with XRE-family HTH domain
MRVVNGADLRERRQRAGLTQRAFGRRAGVTSPYISDIERNRRACPPDILAVYYSLPTRP